MTTFNQDLENFVQALTELELDKDFEQVGLYYSLRELSSRITKIMEKHLTNKEDPYPLPFSLLTIPQLLTIQKFLSVYNFHIEYYVKDHNLHWYKIVPNWK